VLNKAICTHFELQDIQSLSVIPAHYMTSTVPVLVPQIVEATYNGVGRDLTVWLLEFVN